MMHLNDFHGMPENLPPRIVLFSWIETFKNRKREKLRLTEEKML